VLPGGTYREEYLREALEWGWRCRNRPACGVWNSDNETFSIVCHACGAKRPRKDTVERNTKGKR
jgi:hypothetical protein